MAMCKKCKKAAMAGRRRKKRSSVGAFKLPTGYLGTGLKIGAGIVAGKVLGQLVGQIVSKNIPVGKNADGTPIMGEGEVKEVVSGVIQLVGGIAVNMLVKGETGQRISEGMVGSGVVTAASNLIKKLPGMSGVPMGSTFLPGVAGGPGSPYGSAYLPGVAGTVVIE
jgi:hypothetical protein